MLLEQILIGLLLLIMAIQYGYMLFFYSAFPKKTGLKRSVEPAPVSLVICARNELENLRRCLPFWLKQDHPNYEVIVVNDRSWDASQEYLESLQESYPQLRVRNLYDDDRQWIGKKFALTIGIKAATHERVVLTDADCLPSSNSHLRRMAVAGENKSIVLGYGGYSGKSPVAAMVQFETLASTLHWMSWAKRLKPYMGVGRNLSYTRSLFLSKSGFSKHMHLPSGDDDLFISAVGKRRNTTVCLHPKAFTFSKPPESMAHWWRQKRRHLSTGHLYPFGV